MKECNITGPKWDCGCWHWQGWKSRSTPGCWSLGDTILDCGCESWNYWRMQCLPFWILLLIWPAVSLLYPHPPLLQWNIHYLILTIKIKYFFVEVHSYELKRYQSLWTYLKLLNAGDVRKIVTVSCIMKWTGNVNGQRCNIMILKWFICLSSCQRWMCNC